MDSWVKSGNRRRLAVSIMATLMIVSLTLTGCGMKDTLQADQGHGSSSAATGGGSAAGGKPAAAGEGHGGTSAHPVTGSGGEQAGIVKAGLNGGGKGSAPEAPSKPDSDANADQPKPPIHKPSVPTVKLDKPSEPPASYSGKPGAKLAALTFDDGPDGKYTPAILDILKANKIHATFFAVGIQVKHYSSVVKRIVNEGSEIGNHSYSHKDLSKLDSDPILNQIKWTDTLIAKQTGYVPRLVRAPYGAASPLLKQLMKDNHRELINWTVDTRDWSGSPVAAIRANVNKHTHPGGIILMHSFGSKHIANTVAALPLIIKDLQAKGYTFVTVSELLGAKAKNKQARKK
ncbi:polysaccharide deacetylase family protein [Paenibacillus sp. R14(2021)]|uniref:polysaccharide deacetylase family protein n=1 Tax=Paenibacillus sp. R14(2021) TaxID=2859228 RepID=UPI001C61468B|nr:polysaccharide deacetylase family protein [Paenibacillus sp. R14(2021)]